ncbi:glycosyltransferase [bacterium]|nr:glycosyltransferase [bacterium]
MQNSIDSCDLESVIYRIKDNQIDIYWNPVDDADGYVLYSKTSANVFTSIKEVSINEAVLYGVSPDAELKIKPFKLFNGVKSYQFSNIKFVLDRAKSLTKFHTGVIVKKACAKLYWNKIQNANCYKIYRIVDNVEMLIDVVKDNIYKIEYLPYGVSKICLKAFCNDECILESEPVEVNIRSLEMFALNNNYKITLYWNKISGYDGYRIFKKNDKNEFVGFMSSEIESAVIENITLGEVCEFKVKPYKLVDNKRTFDDELSAKCKISAYTTDKIDLTVNEAYGNQISLSWIFDGDVDGFEIFKEDEFYKDIEDGLAHIDLIDYFEGKFSIKGYKKIFGEKIYTSESEKVSVKDSKNRCQKVGSENYKVSVVIPTYNAQNFISRCVSTILGSDLDDVEIVLVDDGSKDNTREILTWYKNRYPNVVKTIFKQNGGAAEARNFGIKEVQGEYIAFIDSDDMIRPTAYSTMYKTLKNTNADIAIGTLYKVDNDRYFVRHTLPFEPYKAFDVEDYMKLIFTEKFNNVAVWNKMYKAELVKSHPIPLLSYEDVSWTPYILSWADKVCYIERVCYEWDRKIRSVTLSNELSNRDVELKFDERYMAVKFFRDNGNQKRRELLNYLMAKRLYNQGVTARMPQYFDAVKEMKEELINNKFLAEDNEYYEKILPLIK